MVKRKRYKKKRKYVRKKKKTYTSSSIGRTRTIGSYGRYARDRELKYKDLYMNSSRGFITTPMTTGIVTLSVKEADTGNATQSMLGKIGTGTGPNQRIGRKITIKKINLNLFVKMPALTDKDKASQMYRIIIAWDRQWNGSVSEPDIESYLNLPSIDSHRNLEQIKRYIPLYDKTFSMQANIAIRTDTGEKVATQEKQRLHKINLKCDMPIEYSSTTGDAAELKTTNLVGWFIPKNLPDQVLALRYQARYRFTG